jgi:hypothetical protein
MSIEKRLFPRSQDGVRGRERRALLAALIVGLICAAVVAVVIYLLYSKQKP